MDNKIVLSNEWCPMDGLTLEDNALASIKEEKNTLIVAGPGAGKTELLAQKACYLFQTNICSSPRKILAISFKTDAASNLKKRVQARCGDISRDRFISLTYDAFAKGLLDRFINSLPDAYRPDPSYLVNDQECVKKAFEESGFINTRGLSPGRLNLFFEAQLASVKLPILTSNTGINERAWLLLIKGNEFIKPCLTFKMITCMAEYIIRTNPYIKKALLLTYSHVFLDEFQDTTSSQYQLVKTCFMETSSVLTAVGDNKQRIMIWAGALETAFNDYCRDFIAVDRALLMNHRSAPRLVELQKMMYGLLKDESKEIYCSPKWNESDGIIRLYKFKDAQQEAELIADDILNLTAEGIASNDICILCKQLPEKYTFEIIDKLSAAGIKARVETEYQDLLKEPLTILILNTLSLLLPYRNPDSWEQVMLFFDSIYNQQMDSPDFLLEKQKSLYRFLDLCKVSISNCLDIEMFENFIDSILLFFETEKIKSLSPVYSQGEYFENTKGKIVKLFWSEYEITNFDLDNSISNFIGINSIPIMTIHKSKGLEYEAVYFIGLEDSAFWNFRNQPMEDRCAFFVALSRAKKNISFTFSETRKVGFNNNQSHRNINEFYNLLEESCLVEVYDNTLDDSE